MDAPERERALGYLQKCDSSEPQVRKVGNILLASDLVLEAKKGWLARTGERISSSYRCLATTTGFSKVVVFFFLVQLVAKTVQVLVFWESPGEIGMLGIPMLRFDAMSPAEFTFSDWGKPASGLVTAGLYRTRRFCHPPQPPVRLANVQPRDHGRSVLDSGFHLLSR